MFVVMRAEATEAEINGVKGLILAEGLTPFENAGEARTVIAVVGEIGRRREQLRARLETTPGVATVTAISKPYKLVSREFHPENTVIRVLDTAIGDGSLAVMAGPCSVESRDQLLETVDFVTSHGATVIRGGAFKPRTSPYSFQGLGVEGLRYLAEARERTGCPVITEVMEPNQVDIVAEYADILQIGTRNMQNFSLLLACGRAGRPVMLKRGFGATIEEWLMAAEYIASAGNSQIMLCERGIRKPLAIGSVAVGADGIMVEVHPRPDEALSDAEQQLDFRGFDSMMQAVTGVHTHVRDLHGDLNRAAAAENGGA